MKIPFRRSSLALAILGATVAHAVEFDIDASASIFNLRGKFRGVSILEQTPGSLAVSFDGAINGELNGGLLNIVGSNVLSLFQPSLQLPVHQGNAQSAFGFRIPLAAGGDALFAIDSLSLYLSTDSNPPLDVADGTFAPADLGFFFNGGTMVGATGGSDLKFIDLHGSGAPNQASGFGTFEISGNIETLTIPIATTVIFSIDAPNDLELTLEGKVVATHVVPEPGVMALLAIVSAGLACCRTRYASALT